MEKNQVSDEMIKTIKNHIKEYNGDLDSTINTMLRKGLLEEPFTRREKTYIASILKQDTDASYDYSSIDEYQERNATILNKYTDEEDINKRIYVIK